MTCMGYWSRFWMGLGMINIAHIVTWLTKPHSMHSSSRAVKPLQTCFHIDLIKPTGWDQVRMLCSFFCIKQRNKKSCDAIILNMHILITNIYIYTYNIDAYVLYRSMQWENENISRLAFHFIYREIYSTIETCGKLNLKIDWVPHFLLLGSFNFSNLPKLLEELAKSPPLVLVLFLNHYHHLPFLHYKYHTYPLVVNTIIILWKHLDLHISTIHTIITWLVNHCIIYNRWLVNILWNHTIIIIYTIKQY